MKNLYCSQGIPQSGERCCNPADEYILYGCLDMHISETALCVEHAVQWTWVQMKYKHKCATFTCIELIEEYLPMKIYNGQ